MTKSGKSLDDLRIELDAIDDAMHDLIMRRAGVVEQVSAAKEHSGGRGVLRPGREARILRRLVERHSGAFPVASVVRIWRELISASVGMQTRFSAGVFRPEPDPGYWDLAREQFGIYAPMTGFASADTALAAVRAGDITVAVLPMPGAGEDGGWWTGMCAGNEDGAPQIIWHLPFTGFASGPSVKHEALVVGLSAQEDSGDDHSLFVFEARAAGGIADLIAGLKAADLVPVTWRSQEMGDASLVLVVLEGFIDPGDARLGTAVADGAVVHGLGGYPVPFAADALRHAAE